MTKGEVLPVLQIVVLDIIIYTAAETKLTQDLVEFGLKQKNFHWSRLEITNSLPIGLLTL